MLLDKYREILVQLNNKMTGNKITEAYVQFTTQDDKDMLDLTKASRRNPDWPDSSFLTPRTTLLPKSTTGTV